MQQINHDNDTGFGKSPKKNASLPCKILLAQTIFRPLVHKYHLCCLINHSSRKIAIHSDTSNMLRGYYTCKLGQTNYLLVSKNVSDS